MYETEKITRDENEAEGTGNRGSVVMSRGVGATD